MALKSCPFFSNWDIHYFFELFNAIVWMWQFFYPVFMSEFFVSFLCVKYYSFHFIVNTIFSKLFYFLLFKFFSFFLFLSKFLVINTHTSPFIPTFFYFWYFNLISNFLIYFSIFFFLKLFYYLIFIFCYK